MATIRDEIAQAIVDGLAPTKVTVEPGRFRGRREGRRLNRRVNRVYVEGHTEPILVFSDDVVLPEWAEPLASGIRLDIQAILAGRRQSEEQSA